MCVVSGASADHFDEMLPLILSQQQAYPCSPFYLFDLGLTREQIRLLEEFNYVKVLTLLSPRPYVEFRGKAWKPTALLQFIQSYPAHHSCGVFFYGDASVRLVRAFDDIAQEELYRNGLIAEVPIKYPQIEYTHPNMYKYFGVDREKSWDEQHAHGNAVLTQVQSGLILIDATNQTMLERFWRRWAACAEDADCLSPDGIVSQPGDRSPKMADNYTLRGTPIFR